MDNESTSNFRECRVLVVAPDSAATASAAKALPEAGYQVLQAATIQKAKEILGTSAVEIILVDGALLTGTALEFLDDLKVQFEDSTVLVLTESVSTQSIIQLLRRGAHDYLPKPFDVETLIHRVHNAVVLRQARLLKETASRQQELEPFSPLVILPSMAMRLLREKVERVAERDGMTVLVTGETGAGKEYVSRLIHNLSPRNGEAFVALNCANLDRTLLQSELFGHERGAFTGAHERRRGLFELASQGTLFLDEVGEMPAEVQSAFLRVLETRRFRRLGGSTELETRTRVVAATNADLREMVKNGRFREDLFFRLNVMELNIPPLRERPEDVRSLAVHFCNAACKAFGIRAHLAEDALEAMARYPWPGNIRELRNVVERTIAISGDGPIGAHLLQLEPAPAGAAGGGVAEEPGGYGTERESADSILKRVRGEASKRFPSLSDVEERYILEVLEACRGNRTQASKILGIARSTLIRRLEEIARDRKERGDPE